jgi:SAM-dependent methyltransferase
MREGSYHRFKGIWNTHIKAVAYRNGRFSHSRKWLWIDRQERAIVAQFLSTLPKGSQVLDIPCGAGRLVSLFQEAGITYFGADISFSMVNLAKDIFDSIPFLLADAMRLPFIEGEFDALISVRLLHRIQEQELRVKMLTEMARIVHGPLLVTYYTRWNLRGIKRWLRGKDPGLTLPQIHQDACLAGLGISRAIPLLRWTQQQWFFRMERA